MRYVLTQTITIPAGSVFEVSDVLGAGGLELAHFPGDRMGHPRIFLGRAAALETGLVVARPQLVAVDG